MIQAFVVVYITDCADSKCLPSSWRADPNHFGEQALQLLDAYATNAIVQSVMTPSDGESCISKERMYDVHRTRGELNEFENSVWEWPLIEYLLTTTPFQQPSSDIESRSQTRRFLVAHILYRLVSNRMYLSDYGAPRTANNIEIFMRAFKPQERKRCRELCSDTLQDLGRRPMAMAMDFHKNDDKPSDLHTIEDLLSPITAHFPSIGDAFQAIVEDAIQCKGAYSTECLEFAVCWGEYSNLEYVQNADELHLPLVDIREDEETGYTSVVRLGISEAELRDGLRLTSQPTRVLTSMIANAVVMYQRLFHIHRMVEAKEREKRVSAAKPKSEKEQHLQHKAGEDAQQSLWRESPNRTQMQSHEAKNALIPYSYASSDDDSTSIQSLAESKEPDSSLLSAPSFAQKLAAKHEHSAPADGSSAAAVALLHAYTRYDEKQARTPSSKSRTHSFIIPNVSREALESARNFFGSSIDEGRTFICFRPAAYGLECCCYYKHDHSAAFTYSWIQSRWSSTVYIKTGGKIQQAIKHIEGEQGHVQEFGERPAQGKKRLSK